MGGIMSHKMHQITVDIRTLGLCSSSSSVYINPLHSVRNRSTSTSLLPSEIAFPRSLAATSGLRQNRRRRGRQATGRKNSFSLSPLRNRRRVFSGPLVADRRTTMDLLSLARSAARPKRSAGRPGGRTVNYAVLLSVPLSSMRGGRGRTKGGRWGLLLFLRRCVAR